MFFNADLTARIVVCGAAATVCLMSGQALADPPPNIAIDRFEFLPVFSGQAGVRVTAVNNNGDFCGYRDGLDTQEFRYIGSTPRLGGFSLLWNDINDAGTLVGSSFQLFPSIAIVGTGSNQTSFVSGLGGYVGINNEGWILGVRDNDVPYRIDDTGLTDLPSAFDWDLIDADGRVWGNSILGGGSDGVFFKTRFGPTRDLGTFGADAARAACVNRNGDWGGLTQVESAGFVPSVALAVIGDVEHHIPSQTGNNAVTLAVTVDGQIIGTDAGLCVPECDGKFGSSRMACATTSTTRSARCSDSFRQSGMPPPRARRAGSSARQPIRATTRSISFA